MGLMRRFAFYLGLALGVITVAAAGSVVLTYLLTGKLPMLGVDGDSSEVTLMTPDEVASTIREKAGKAQGAEVTEPTAGGGEDDEE
jgi:hypothetical protein